MAIYLTHVSVIGVSKEATTFGDHQHRYRSTKTVEIEGFVDGRHSNPDNAGTEGVMTSIETIRDNVWGTTASTIPMDDIYINGTGLGKGQITSINFPAEQNILSSQIYYGAYEATIQFYEAGDVGATLENVTIPDMEFLEDFSESFNVSLSESQDYSLDHDINIKYLSGVRANGTSVDPIANAKTLATNLYAQTPTQFSTSLGNYYGNISTTAKKRTTETYDAIKGDATFARRLSLGPASGLDGNYSKTINHNFSIDQMGFCTVKEDGELTSQDSQFSPTINNGIINEIATSYSRCNTIYNAYKSDLSTATTNTRSLYSQATNVERANNVSQGVGSYSITYTDNSNQWSRGTDERSITISTPTWDGQITVSEKGTVTQRNPVGDWDGIWTILPSRSQAKSRCQNIYNKFVVNGGSPYMSLKNLKNSFSIPRRGKAVSYSYEFTDNPENIDYIAGPGWPGSFSKISSTQTTEIGAATQSSVQIPNIAYQVMQTPGFTKLGKRSVKFDGQLRRYRASAWTNTLSTMYNVNSSASLARNICLTEAYRVFADNSFILSRDMGQLYIDTASYTYDSSHKFTMNLSAVYTMVRPHQPGYSNLIFR